MINIKSKVDSTRYDVEAQHSLKVTPYLRLAYGASVRLDQLKAPFYLGHNDTKEFHLQRLFTQAEFLPSEKMFINFFTQARLSNYLQQSGFEIIYQEETTSQDPDSMSAHIIYTIGKKIL